MLFVWAFRIYRFCLGSPAVADAVCLVTLALQILFDREFPDFADVVCVGSLAFVVTVDTREMSACVNAAGLPMAAYQLAPSTLEAGRILPQPQTVPPKEV